MKKILTLIIIHKDNKVLLGMKKRGFGEGRWNGFGGKLHDNEQIEDAAIREVKEEINIDIEDKDLIKSGIITFYEADPKPLEVHIFSVKDYKGEPIETEEMKPRWFNADKIPYDVMWPDDKYWLPLLLEGKKFKGEFYFSNNTEKIDKYNLGEVKEL